MIEKIYTGDGSTSLYIKDIEETYHARQGAYTESLHVYIQQGLLPIYDRNIDILEVGWGTGLNTLITIDSIKQYPISYTALEPFPLPKEIIEQLYFPTPSLKLLHKLHSIPFESKYTEIPKFEFCKIKLKIEDFETTKKYDLIYFDAFAPNKQKEIWSKQNFHKIYSLMNNRARLVTYCANGQFKRNLREIGFEAHHPPGAHGKREMTVAIKK